MQILADILQIPVASVLAGVDVAPAAPVVRLGLDCQKQFFSLLDETDLSVANLADDLLDCCGTFRLSQRQSNGWNLTFERNGDYGLFVAT